MIFFFYYNIVSMERRYYPMLHQIEKNELSSRQEGIDRLFDTLSKARVNDWYGPSKIETRRKWKLGLRQSWAQEEFEYGLSIGLLMNVRK